MLRLTFLSWILFSTPAFATMLPSQGIATTETPESITMDNALCAFTLAKTGPHAGVITSIKARIDGTMRELGNGSNAMAFDFDNHTRAHVAFGSGAIKVLAKDGPLGEVSIAIPASNNCPFNVEEHYLLRQGDPGFYFYVTYHHTKDMPACTFEQTRAVIRPVKGTELFTNYIVDDNRKGPYPAGPCSQVFDTTWRYQFDGQIHSKYDYANFIGDDLIHGLAGQGIPGETNRTHIPVTVGMWLIAPSREYVNAGPLRQELTTHQDSPTGGNQNNIVLWMLAGNHFGGPNTEIKAGQEWSHFYGPAFLYINSGNTTDATWENAKKRAAAEDAAWPYNFVHHPDYPLDRGTLSGTVKVSSGDSVKGAWVVLAPPGEKDWCMSSTGYEFWTKADENGRFSIDKIRPGNYSLHVCGANQFEDYFQDNVEVKAGNKDLGVVHWTAITHGKRLWQIGMPDRSTQEFKDGLNQRHFTNMTRYSTNFPNDVTFTIGKSKESEDWNFAQYPVYVKQPYWSVLFDSPAAQSGKATLTIAFAAYQSAMLNLILNDKPLAAEPNPIRFQKSGMAFYRSGGQDSLRQTAVLTFDAAAIRAGQNELRLQIQGAQKVVPGTELNNANQAGGVMYDALRLEVAP